MDSSRGRKHGNTTRKKEKYYTKRRADEAENSNDPVGDEAVRLREEMADDDKRGPNRCNDEEGATEIDEPFFTVPTQELLSIKQPEIEIYYTIACIRKHETIKATRMEGK